MTFPVNALGIRIEIAKPICTQNNDLKIGHAFSLKHRGFLGPFQEMNVCSKFMTSPLDKPFNSKQAIKIH
jgi:hypothetical protein